MNKKEYESFMRSVDLANSLMSIFDYKLSDESKKHIEKLKKQFEKSE